jgi:hypothetical protein
VLVSAIEMYTKTGFKEGFEVTECISKFNFSKNRVFGKS